MKRACDRLWEVDAFREGALTGADAQAHERHRATCADCRLRFEQDAQLVRLGKAVVPPVDDVRVRRLRMQILRRAAEGGVARPQPRRFVPAAAALALTLLTTTAWWAVHGHASRPIAPAATTPVAMATGPVSARVDPWPGARWWSERAGDTVRVHLEEGTLGLIVRHQQPTERFFVVLPDGDIEVRGTQFDVTVSDAHTRSVHVTEGVVALRIDGAAERLLPAGSAWVLGADEPAAALPPPPVASRAAKGAARPMPATLTAAPRADASAEASGAIESEYASAMQLYDAHRYAQAATAFRIFASAHPSAPEAEDAEFLEASSLAFSGRTDAAALLAERFLARHPRSFHARHAALLVARAARDRGDCDKARAAVAPFPGTPEVTSALGSCAEPSTR